MAARKPTAPSVPPHMDLEELARKMELIAKYDPASSGANKKKPRALGANKLSRINSVEQESEDSCRDDMITMSVRAHHPSNTFV